MWRSPKREGVNPSSKPVLLESYLKKKSTKSVLGRHVWRERYFVLHSDKVLHAPSERRVDLLPIDVCNSFFSQLLYYAGKKYTNLSPLEGIEASDILRVVKSDKADSTDRFEIQLVSDKHGGLYKIKVATALAPNIPYLTFPKPKAKQLKPLLPFCFHARYLTPCTGRQQRAPRQVGGGAAGPMQGRQNVGSFSRHLRARAVPAAQRQLQRGRPAGGFDAPP